MIELQIKDLTTNEILASGSVSELVSMYEEEEEVLEAIDNVLSSKQAIKIYGFAGLVYEVSIVDNNTEEDEIKTTLKNEGLSIQQMIELQIKDLTTNEILASGSVSELVSMYEEEEEVLETIDNVLSSKQAIKIYGFAGLVYEVSIVDNNTEEDEIKTTLKNEGLSIQQISEFHTQTEEKQYTVYAFHDGQYITMIIVLSDIEKYVDIIINGRGYFDARVDFVDCSLKATLIEAMNIIKQHTKAN